MEGKAAVIYHRLLTCVRSLVGLQVGAFGVDLFTAEELAFVYPSLRVRTVIVLSLVMFRCHNWGRNGKCNELVNKRSVIIPITIPK